MNKAILMGRLTRDPEVRYSQSAEPIAIVRFAIAINRRFKRDETDFIDCVAFGKTGEFINSYFKKGAMIAVEGSIQTSSWDDKESGQKRYRTEVIVDQAHFTGSKNESGGGNYSSNNHYDDMAASYSSSSGQNESPSNNFETMEVDDDDLPF
ncbi:MAG: single-stranded DNA-binding protein [Defluviitaleaceae bacterium]|nr:single-stranded DNA-binding protein [Defluviitaleaceae bacterium]